MVGRDLLIGLALGTATLVILRLAWLAAAWAGFPRPPLTGVGPFALRLPGPPAPLYVLLSLSVATIIVPLMYLGSSFVCFLVLRREWLAWGAVFLFFTAMFAVPFLGPSPAANVVTFLMASIPPAASVFVMARFG